MEESDFNYEFIRGGPAPEEEQTVKSEKKPAYTGSGYRLGSEDEPSSLAQPSSPIAPAIVEDTEPVKDNRHRVFFYLY